MTTKSKRRHNSSTNAFLEKLNGGPLTFSQALAAIRLADELSLAAFAERLGISRTHLSDIEHGRRSVSLQRASEFATLQVAARPTSFALLSRTRFVTLD